MRAQRARAIGIVATSTALWGAMIGLPAAAEGTTIVESVTIASGKSVNLNPHVAGEHRGLKVRARVSGSTGESVTVRAQMAQYDSRGGQKVTPARISLDSIPLRLVRTRDDVSTYVGMVSFADLQVAGARIAEGGKALLCLESVSAESGGSALPLSSEAVSDQGGTQCITVRHRRGGSKDVNSLYTGMLRDVTMTKGAGALRYLTFGAEDLASFSDRPARAARTVPFADLATKSTWRRIFQRPNPVVEVALEGTTRHVPVRMAVPKEMGDGRYRAKIRFPTGSRLTPGEVAGQDLAFFASATPVDRPDPETCPAQSRALGEGHVPSGSDFVGSLAEATLTVEPGGESLRLESTDPLSFNWYRGAGYGCDSRRTGATDFTELADPTEWAALFGRILPNSALLWEDGDQTRVLEFEQDMPEFDADTGTWVSVVRPFFGDSVPSRSTVDRFVREFGPSLSVSAPYLFMDATGSAVYGGGSWVMDENFSIQYHVQDNDVLNLTFQLLNGLDGWMGLCFHEFMFPADCIVAWWDEDQPFAWDTYNPGIPTLPFFPSPVQDTDPMLVSPGGSPMDNKDNITQISGSNANDVLSISVQRPLITEDIFDFQIYPDQIFHVIGAYSADEIFDDVDDAIQPEHTAYGSDEWEFME